MNAPSKRGKTYALRYRANGQRHYETLGTEKDGWTRQRAAEELEKRQAAILLGVWQPPTPAPVVEIAEDPDFWAFASEWIAAREQEGLGVRTIEDYKWALTGHLLPFFKDHRLTEITVREVDRYKTAKAAEGVLSANSINKTLTRLSQVMASAVEYGLVAANPAAGRRRRLKGTRPARLSVEPEQLMALLEEAAGDKPLLAGRGRPLLATLAGAGLRIGEALALERRDVNVAKGTLTVRASKTEAGVRVVDLTPALRDELALWLDRLPAKGPTDLVFPTLSGQPDNRNNVRVRLFHPAIERANKTLAKLGIEPIGNVTPHGLRRTYASLRSAVGDDPAYTASQLGHEDPGFTLRVYTQAVKRRDRLTGAELEAFDRAIQWAQMGTNGVTDALTAEAALLAMSSKPAAGATSS